MVRPQLRPPARAPEALATIPPRPQFDAIAWNATRTHSGAPGRAPARISENVKEARPAPAGA